MHSICPLISGIVTIFCPPTGEPEIAPTTSDMSTLASPVSTRDSKGIMLNAMISIKINIIGIINLIPRYIYFLPSFLLCAIPIDAINRKIMPMAINNEKGIVIEPIGIGPVKPGTCI